MNHHDDPDLLAALRTDGSAMRLHLAEADLVFAEARDQNFDQTSFAGLEIAEQQIAALAVNINDLSGAHGLSWILFLNGLVRVAG